MARIRVVQGSCWSCKKRRVKCDLTKPACQRCIQTGARCDYNARLIRWSTRSTVRDVPRICQLAGLGHNGLEAGEKRALDYFHLRVWPLLQTSEELCAPPLPVAIENRVVLLAACVLAGSHQLLQDGRGHLRGLNSQRLECLAAIRSEVDGCVGGCSGSLLVLLFAVLLLHLHDGFMELHGDVASTASHHQGVVAILVQLGGLESVFRLSQEPLQMLLTEFVSADLTTALIHGTVPSYDPGVWDLLDQGAVWWGRDPLGRHSLAAVFREMSSMAFYLDSNTNKETDLCMEKVRAFEVVLHPIYAPLLAPASSGMSEADSDRSVGDRELEATHAFALIRAFQHTGLIFLYRAICGLPILHPLVQQHVQSCLNCILEIERSSKVLHCVVFPLYVAGAHAQSSRHQQAIVDLVDFIYDSMRFASVKSIASALSYIWRSQSLDSTWNELFQGHSPHVLVL